MSTATLQRDHPKTFEQKVWGEYLETTRYCSQVYYEEVEKQAWKRLQERLKRC